MLLLNAIALFSAFNFNILTINGASHLLKFPSILYFVDEIDKACFEVDDKCTF